MRNLINGFIVGCGLTLGCVGTALGAPKPGCVALAGLSLFMFGLSVQARGD